MVVLVLNFMLFDDIFQTIFSSGENDMVVYAICNHLLKSNQDVYAKDEFSVDGELIYPLSPFNEVWLSEPECHDRREKRQGQCHRQEE